MIFEVAIVLQWAIPILVSIFSIMWIARKKLKCRWQLGKPKFSNYVKYGILLFAVLLTAFSIVGIYVRGYSWPVGRDAVNYVYALELYEYSGISLDDFLLSYRINQYSTTLLTFLPFFIFRLFGLNWQQILPVAQVVYSVVYCLLVYVFIKKTIKLDMLASYCALLTAASTFSLILGVTLNRNLVALIIVICFWLTYIGWLKSRTKTKFLISFGLFAFLSVQYQAVAFILSITMIMFVLINRYYREKRVFFSSILFPSFLAVFLISCDLYNLAINGVIIDPGLSYPSHLVQQVGVSSGFLFNLFENINPIATFGKYSNLFLLNFLENPILLCLAIIGLAAIILRTPIADKRDSKMVAETYTFLLSWSLLVSAIFLFSNLEMNGYRLILNLPIGVFSGFGLYWLSTNIVDHLRLEKHENA